MSIVTLFPIDISPMVAALPALDEAWSEETWRQSLHFTPHRDSETIFLRRQPGSRPRDVLHQLASVATRYFAVPPFAAAVEGICERLVGRPGRAMIVRLKPGGVIEEHTDIGIYADATERVHVPLVTNPGAWLRVDGERYHLEPGWAYTIDKHVEHSGANEGDEYRIHLIVDYFPDSPAVFAG